MSKLEELLSICGKIRGMSDSMIYAKCAIIILVCLASGAVVIAYIKHHGRAIHG